MVNIKQFYDWYTSLEGLEKDIVDRWADGWSLPELNDKYPEKEHLIDELVGYYEDHFVNNKSI